MARTSGFATPEGTHRFAERASATHPIPHAHFRTAVDGLILSSLGMGSYLGSPTPADDPTTIQAVIESVQSGAVNVIDTAINYRHQLSERAIGQALQQLFQNGIQRDELFIASKNGFIAPDAGKTDTSEDFRKYFIETFIETGLVKPDEIAGGIHCMSPGYLANQLDRSLENLQLETLDLMYLHNAAESQIPAVGREVFMKRLADAFAFYEQARQAGKIRYYGLATWTCFRAEPREPEYLALADIIKVAEQVGGKTHGFRYIQLPFNMAMPEALTWASQPIHEGVTSLLDAAQAFGIGVFTSVPLLQGELLTQPLPKFDSITTPAQTCLQFVRSTPGVVAPLVGHKQPAHVQDNLGVAQVPPMPFEDFQTLLAAHVG